MLGGDHPLLALDNPLCAPHLGYLTADEWELQFADVFEQVRSFASGRRSTW